MAIKGYLAMTAAEFRDSPSFETKIAWMACHFSPYGTSLSNCPNTLPPDSLLILNDRTPICGHDPEQILGRLTELVQRFSCSGVLLDFQRSGEPETARLAMHLLEQLPCPAAVSEAYATYDRHPVFLPPVPPEVPVEEYLAPWKGREIWLEVSLEGRILELTEEGLLKKQAEDTPAEGHWDEELCCHYRIAVDDRVRFSLYRTEEDLRQLLTRAEKMGVARAVGLYQELGAMEF